MRKIVINCVGDSVTEGMSMVGHHTSDYGKASYPARLYTILKDNNFGFHYEGQVDISELTELEKDYKIFSKTKLENQTYSKKEMVNIFEQINYHNNFAGVIERPLIENKTLVDKIILIPRLPLFPEEILA